MLLLIKSSWIGLNFPGLSFSHTGGVVDLVAR